MKTFAIILAAPIAMFAAVPAAATPAISTTALEVRTADLALDTKAGIDRLNHRIDKAARTVCGIGADTTGHAILDPRQRECYDKAVAGAQRQVAGLVDARRLATL